MSSLSPDPLPGRRHVARIELMALGFGAAIAQATLLREAMAALGGSEMAWGLVMAVWLAAAGLGARLGARWGPRRLAPRLPAAMLGLAACGTVLLRAAPALAAGAGEVPTTWGSLWIWLVAVAPTAMLGGLAFPLLADHPAIRTAGAAYALESAGAFVGGLAFTFALAPRGTAAVLVVSLGLVLAVRVSIGGAAIGGAAIGGWSDASTGGPDGGPTGRSRSRLIVVAGAAGCVALSAVVAGPATGLLAELTWAWSGRPGELAHWAETAHQRLELAAGEPTALYADGRLVASYPEPYLVEPRTHLLMLLHPEPRRVLLAGGLADGCLETILRHPVERLVVVENDPALPELLAQWSGPGMAAALADPRVRIGHADPLRALASQEQWDLVLLLGGNPVSLRANRMRTLELLEAVSRRLGPDGRLVLRVDISGTYLDGMAGRLLATLGATLSRCLGTVRVLPTEPVLLVAGAGATPIPDLDVLERRWQERGIESSLLTPEMLPLLLDPPRARRLEQVIEKGPGEGLDGPTPGRRAERARADALNTLDHPRAVLPAAALLEGRGQPGLVALARILAGAASSQSRRTAAWLGPVLGLALGLAMALVLGSTINRRATGLAATTVIGCGSMSWWILLLATWQATRGSVYSEIGALTAWFMGGLALGAAGAARRPEPRTLLPRLAIGAAGLSAAIAAGLASLAPTISIPVMLVAAGLLGGATFTGAADLLGRGSRHAAGLGLAADELGAAVGALLTALVTIPLIGMRATALGLAALQLSTLPALLVHGRPVSHPPPPDEADGPEG